MTFVTFASLRFITETQGKIRRASQVTMESHQRTVAAYRRQRDARDMEQTAYLRAEAEVEKALMLKRNSVDERRPSYVLRMLEDLEELEEGQEETEAEQNPVITIDSCSEVNIKSDSRDLMLSSSAHASKDEVENPVRDNKEVENPVRDNTEAENPVRDNKEVENPVRDNKERTLWRVENPVRDNTEAENL
ncbi:hypothetical protein QZH41_007058 [Actinostola sp. cb2023]|nr:hypothetical protein QZH41_007058 [Actinostola sp. cb2023]